MPFHRPIMFRNHSCTSFDEDSLSVASRNFSSTPSPECRSPDSYSAKDSIKQTMSEPTIFNKLSRRLSLRSTRRRRMASISSQSRHSLSSLSPSRTISSNLEIPNMLVDLSTRIAGVLEQNALQVQSLLDVYKRRHYELRKERNDQNLHILAAWDAVISEFDKRAEADIHLSRFLCNQLSAPLQEIISMNKSTTRRIFHNKDTFEQLLDRQEECLEKVLRDYNDAYTRYKSSFIRDTVKQGYYQALEQPESLKNNHLIAHLRNMHNAYIMQLRACNSWSCTYERTVLPDINKESDFVNEEIRKFLKDGLDSQIKHMTEQNEQSAKRMANIRDILKKDGPPENLSPTVKLQKDPERIYKYSKPDPTAVFDFMRNELVCNDETEAVLKRKYYVLLKESDDLEESIERYITEVETLRKRRQSPPENVINQSQDDMVEDINDKQQEIRELTCQLAACKAQLSLFNCDWWPEEHFSTNPHSQTNRQQPKYTMFEASERTHNFQDHSCKRLTHCDYCRNIIKGVVKAALKCKHCKLIVHSKCSENVSYCTRQPPNKSKGRATPPVKLAPSGKDEIDPIFQAISFASSLSTSKSDQTSNSSASSSRKESVNESNRQKSLSPHRAKSHSGQLPPPPPVQQTSSSHPGMHPHRSNIPEIRLDNHLKPSGKLSNNQERSFSMESSDSWPKSSGSNSSRSPPSSPHSMAHRNEILCIATYDFEGKSPGDMTIYRGDIITITDNTTPDWLHGEIGKRSGYFPENCVIPIGADEKIMRVTHNYFGSDENVDELSLRKDQIVIYSKDEQAGWAHVKADNGQIGVFPLCYLTRVR